ncbi:TetR family transcriptional regulator [Leifsonia sp. NCR5]|uniref:TetR family transcriptional regulator n=1 Tax=Leifsonia sp. NCR5 TaxID=1978342 RepID=UPI000A18B35F|nr:TetR family transcriptional regulator [Leifsonia sp. NCR5]
MNSPAAEQEQQPAARRRGRPVDVDPDEVALLALRHFAEHGYEATTMDDIARVAGIGRRTLFRYFPSKPALVWGGMEPVVARTAAELDAAPDDEPIASVLHRAIARALDLPPDRVEATRRRLLLIGSDDALIGFGLSRLAANRDVLAAFIARRTGTAPDGLHAKVRADALSAASFSALTWWAANSDDDPATVVAAALDALSA